MFVVLLLFGAKKLPELMKGMGKGIKEFKKASSDITSELERATYEDDHHHQPQHQEKVKPEEKQADANSEEKESSSESKA